MRHWLFWAAMALTLGTGAARAEGIVVLESDLGDEVEVAALKGLIFGVDRGLNVVDLSHDVPSQDIWIGAYQLSQVVPSWPAGTVFVGIVDADANRPALVARLKTGQIVVGPDNGLLTLLADQPGLADVRQLQPDLVQKPPFESPRKFAARDRFAMAGALLAANKLSFDQAGPPLGEPVMIPYTHATFVDGEVVGTIPDIDPDQGDAKTNIGSDLLAKLSLREGERVHARIDQDKHTIWEGNLVLARAPGDVPEGDSFVYVDEHDRVALGVNMGSFADQNGIGAGPDWTLSLRK
ncbi:hypothetical protein SAMN07250955_10347 [Arboricoccus pini]|uniref:S-adenosyl-l-methionine hydroxide adenosyltransferase n=1 Tax=Arboricoccus pini TaxID=1963835 RepID=A0A212QRE2_9PROT|nr:SAM-dependent chlorinase/fluorinase [Arboricoccus pini]SNB62148.1 hypothetical protein SAMN07250955_10347 [Arboricoccus pini]